MFYSKPSGLHFIVCLSDAHLQRAVLGASVQLEVIDADGRDDVSFPPGVAGAVGERHLVVALARPQQTQVLTKYDREHNVHHPANTTSKMWRLVFGHSSSRGDAMFLTCDNL